ncbi:MAG TPA: ATP-binding protein [Polyangiales bacterium]|nr:ATP-binding protein [Polyangiales bacterium]
MTLLLTTDIRVEDDVVLARQRARQIAATLGFEQQDQTRVATALSEVARNALQHAGRGSIQFHLEEQPDAVALRMVVSDRGPGIGDVDALLRGQKPSGAGLVAARKLMDGFEIESQPGSGTQVRMHKRLRGRAPLSAQQRAALNEALVQRHSEVLLEAARGEDRVLARTLLDLQQTQRELEFLNRELEETNRGVMVLYNELEEKAEALRRSQAAKNQFFSEMNHEVRTPINSILNLAELLINGSLVKPLPEQETALGYIRKAASHLSELVDDLLELSRSEAGKLVVRPSTFSVESLFGGLRGMFRPLHTREDVRLVFADASGLPELHTDEGKVAQVLRNFISNALKFTERGSVTVSAELSGDDVVFAVRDTGIGIDPSQHEALFTPFTQIENPHQKRVKGTGLGLSLTRALCELLGGKITLESELGVGSTFRAIIPRNFPAGRASQPAPARDAILIIDDDEIARYLLRGAIGQERHAFLEAGSGAEGLRVAREQRPRVIFLDLRMPELDGYKVLDQLKADPATRDIPVVIHTSQRLQARDREHLARLTAGIVDKELLHQASGRAALEEILARTGVGHTG